LPPAEFGTAVHTNLKRQIDGLSDPDFRAEVSYLKIERKLMAEKIQSASTYLRRSATEPCVYTISRLASGA
jgi:hypothetical protein